MVSVRYYARASGSRSLEIIRVKNGSRIHILINPEPIHKATIPTSAQNQIIPINPDTLDYIILLKEQSNDTNTQPYPSPSAISSAVELAMISNATIITSPIFDFWESLATQLPKRLLGTFPFEKHFLSITLFSFYNPKSKEKRRLLSRFLKPPLSHFSMGVSLRFEENTTIGCLSHWFAFPRSQLLTDNLTAKFTHLLSLTDQAELLPYDYAAKRTANSRLNAPLIRNNWELITTIW